MLLPGLIVYRVFLESVRGAGRVLMMMLLPWMLGICSAPAPLFALAAWLAFCSILATPRSVWVAFSVTGA